MNLSFALLALLGLGATPAPAPADSPLMYTTYFYTAGEAIIHGYEAGTKVRVVSLQNKRTIWGGVVGAGDTKLVQTGPGVFGFIADKKATILVGTPSSCTCVGYYLKDENGSFKSTHFYGMLPEASGSAQHFLVWAYEPSAVQLFKRGEAKPFRSVELPAGGYLDLTGPELQKLGGKTIELKASNHGVTAEVYYDEGFMVPADNGSGSGRRFLTYVGTITDNTNDLNIIAQGLTTNVTVRDLRSGKTLFAGPVEQGQIKTLQLANVYVEVLSEAPVNVVVAAFAHSAPGYAEQHFQTGLEGSGIENDFLVTTSGDLWLFSYFSDNAITVEDARSGAKLFSGRLQAGQVRGLSPGVGLFKVKASKGLSVMGGASSCGADFSPAGSMFAFDEALFAVLADVRAERVQAAAAKGRQASDDELAAPMTATEYSHNVSKLAPAAAKKALSLEEVNERAAQMKLNH